MDDTDRIKSYTAGEPSAFGALVERYQREAVGHALAILRCREDALDAVQEAFLAAFQAIGRFTPGQPFYPWFYTILRNRCYKMLERRDRTRPIGIDSEILAPPTDPADADQSHLLEQALADLSAEDRELITLKHLDGLRYEDLAKRLGIPPGTVMSRLYHARRRLRDGIIRLRDREEAHRA
jgi:RNA polymerase sigma-70 factor, ECF subfamily